MNPEENKSLNNINPAETNPAEVPSESSTTAVISNDNPKVSLAGDIAEPITEKPIVKESPTAIDMIKTDPKKSSFSTTLPITNNQPALDGLKRFQFNVSEKYIKVLRIFLILSICCISTIGIFILGSLFNIDLLFFKITFEGKVLDSATNQPVKDAKIFMAEKEVATTDEKGSFTITNLTPKVAELTIKANGFKDYKQEVAITRGILNYSTKYQFLITPSELASLSGKLIPNISGYNFLSDKLIIQEKEYEIKSDGTFEARDLKAGGISLKFEAQNFKDFTQSYTLQPGSNKLEDINLEASGDVEGELTSWLTDELVLDTNFSIENVLINQVDINENGKFKIKDLDLDREYKLRISSTGYRTRDYSLKIKQGLNEIFKLRLVDDVEAVYLEQNVNNNQITISDLDGENKVQLTKKSNFEPTQLIYTSEEKIQFLSTHENARGTNISTPLNFPYELDPTTQVMARLTSTLTNVGSIYPNLNSKKLINVFTKNTSIDKVAKLEIMDFNANNRKELKSITQGSFKNIMISDDGKIVYYSMLDYVEPANSGFYRYDLTSSNAKLISNGVSKNPSDKDIAAEVIFDVDSTGEKVIFLKWNTITKLTDLMIYTSSTNQTRLLDENFDGRLYQFIEGRNNELLYLAEREGKTTIFKFNLDDNKDERVMTLADNKITSFRQQGKYIFYYTDKGLYVLNILNPKPLRLVSETTRLGN